MGATSFVNVTGAFAAAPRASFCAACTDAAWAITIAPARSVTPSLAVRIASLQLLDRFFRLFFAQPFATVAVCHPLSLWASHLHRAGGDRLDAILLDDLACQDDP